MRKMQGLSIQNKIDTYIAFAVGIQSLLAILEHILLDMFYVGEESVTSFRVVLTMCTMVPAIVLSAIRKPVLFIVTYVVVFIILVITILLYPANQRFIVDEGFRFLLPMSIPSCLCVIAIRNYVIFEKTLYKISITTSVFVIIYCLGYVLGIIYFKGYSMGFGYACLLPMALLYSRDNKISKFISFILLAAVLALGSRGAAISFVVYVVLDCIFYDRKHLPFFLGICMIVILVLPYFIAFLGSMGIESRTLSMILEGEIVNHDSGRNELYASIRNGIVNEPFGHGLYGDRVMLDGSYCHNFFLELFYDLGIIGGGIVCLFVIGFIINVFAKSNRLNKRRLLLFVVVIFVPLMMSNSFLKDFNFGLLVGVLASISSLNHKNKSIGIKSA